MGQFNRGLNLPPGFSLLTVEAAPDQNEATLKLTARPYIRVADPSTPLLVSVTKPK